MACLCPPKEESNKKGKLLCRLRKIIKDIEDETAVPVSPICVPCCIPICNFPELIQCPAASADQPRKEVTETPNVMVSSCKLQEKRNKSFSERQIDIDCV